MSKADGLNILVVDDEKIVRHTLTAFLKRVGCRVENAEDGISGLRKLESGDYDAAFVDFRMPGLDGIELLRRIKKVRTDIRIIIISGHASFETQQEAMQEGAFHYLQKPFKFDSIQELAEKLAARKPGADKEELEK
ncbi:response regulator [Thermodesulfobacteriota bacterium]